MRGGLSDCCSWSMWAAGPTVLFFSFTSRPWRTWVPLEMLHKIHRHSASNPCTVAKQKPRDDVHRQSCAEKPSSPKRLCSLSPVAGARCDHVLPPGCIVCNRAEKWMKGKGKWQRDILMTAETLDGGKLCDQSGEWFSVKNCVILNDALLIILTVDISSKLKFSFHPIILILIPFQFKPWLGCTFSPFEVYWEVRPQNVETKPYWGR